MAVLAKRRYCHGVLRREAKCPLHSPPQPYSWDCTQWHFSTLKQDWQGRAKDCPLPPIPSGYQSTFESVWVGQNCAAQRRRMLSREVKVVLGRCECSFMFYSPTWVSSEMVRTSYKFLKQHTHTHTHTHTRARTRARTHARTRPQTKKCIWTIQTLVGVYWGKVEKLAYNHIHNLHAKYKT